VPEFTTAPTLPLHPPTEGERRYLNRELTWLSFNDRVLALAEDPRVPLLERVKFTAIFASNLDEFFQVRVAGVMEQAAASSMSLPPDGMTPNEQLAAIRTMVNELVDRQTTVLHDEILPELAEHDITLPRWEDLDEDEQAWLTEEFDQRVFPVLTPLAVDPAHPFPYISNLSLNLAVEVRDPVSGDPRFARIKVPTNLPRFVKLPERDRFIPLEQVIADNLDRLFPGLEVVDHHVFRVVRNADMDVEEDEADDLLRAIEDELNRRRFGRVVRLEVEPSMPDATRRLLMRELGVADEVLEVVKGPLDLEGLWAMAGVDRPDLEYESYQPTVPPRLGAAQSGTIFAEIRRGDILLHHPYDDFDQTVLRFVREAARDPHVLAIKITLYRTSGPGSPLVRALLQAADEGKQVVALVELKARFDEEANIEWARVLEEAGVHVAYGVVGLKTHTKTALVVRDEGDRLRRYAHIGTGNYNDKTARLYEDLGILTADEELGADLSDLFNVLTGYSRRSSYRRLLVAPNTLAPRLVDLMAEQAALGEDGKITMKMNSLADEEMIEALYAASQAGVTIELIVRGICCMRSGVPGLSENITIRSIVGRYLEHSRIYRFGTPETGRTHLIGSADLMGRNLHRRVEAVTEVTDELIVERLDEVLDVLLADNRLAWHQRPDGSWHRPAAPTDAVETHVRLQSLAMDRSRPRQLSTGAGQLAGRVRAAGGVVLRDRRGVTEVLVVHRPRYDDWSLPKGKLDQGESWEECALREVHEETGVAVALGPELTEIAYTDRKGRPKTVRWWLMSAVEGHPSHRGVDREVDEARWVDVEEVWDLLSYDTDVQLLDEAIGVRDAANDNELAGTTVGASAAEVVEAAAAGGLRTAPSADAPSRPPVMDSAPTTQADEDDDPSDSAEGW
jgi:polyphosphate kinase